MDVSWAVTPCNLVEVYWFTDVSEVLASSVIRVMIALMIEASVTSEMSVNFYQTTWCNNQGDIHLHTHHHENLKSC
jgi:hypothetical protein